MEKELAERIALFRFGVIAPLVDRHLSRGERERILGEITGAVWQIPGSPRSAVARSTVLKWVAAYRNSGGDIRSLEPRPRIDRGSSRSIDEESAAALVTLKRELPECSLQTLLTLARRRGALPPGFAASRQSIYRLFVRHGLAERQVKPVDRRKFEAELPNDLWQSDWLHAPKVQVGGVLRKTYLFAVLDDHSRLITHAQFYTSESIDSFRDCIIQALEKRGLPRRLYTDNGSAFRTHLLRYACARLGIALLHSRPGIPEGRGKIERFFRTVRSQLLPLLTEAKSLEELNAGLTRWLEQDYQVRVHSSTHQAPLERYLEHLHAIRPAPKDVRDYFRFPAVRKVDKDRTVSLDGRLFEAPVGLIGRSVTLLYNKEDPLRVEALFEEHSHGFLVPLDPLVNSRVRRTASQNIDVLPTGNPPPANQPYRGGSLFGETPR
ncbi:MAG: IS481 family transposase [Spirochaetaceae bacterium]|nr:MAG: IS481 family transposase [Spirochaetaceae bacterium]